MPQLVKGGKYVYGWISIQESESITIPEEAFREYGFLSNENIIVFEGSKRSGGFYLTSEHLLANSAIEKALIRYPTKNLRQKPVSERIKNKKRKFWTAQIKGYEVRIPKQILQGIKIKRLLVVLGSGKALGFIAKGPIYEEAERNVNVPSF